MISSRELTERKAAILRALVRHYIKTGEPVGSEVLNQAASLGVSAATIRNELAALEEMGYLAQPHPSAGRIPTDLAYRTYVDLLPARLRLRDTERLAIVQFFDEALADVDAILRGTTHLLSRLTRYASLAMAPNQRQTGIARAELIRLGTSTLLLVVLDSGQVEKRVVDLPPDLADEDVDRLSRTLTDAVRGLTLEAATDEVAARAATLPTVGEQVVFRNVAESMRSLGETAEVEHLFMGGVSNIAADEAFDRRETLRQVYEALERESAVLRLMRAAAATTAPITVTIGRENPLPEMWQASLVAAQFGSGGATGTIGVVGPIRMDYASAISAVRAVAERLSAAVEALAH
jgi:heat-inducible transcriptional repressor